MTDLLAAMHLVTRTVEAALRVPAPLRWLAVLLWAGMRAARQQAG